MEGLKKTIAALIVLAVLFFAALAILSIWDIILVEKLFKKSLWTLVVIFCATTVILFVFSNFLRQDKNGNNQPPR